MCLYASNLHAVIEHQSPLRVDLWKIRSSKMTCVITQEIELWGDFSIVKNAGHPAHVVLNTTQSLPYEAYYVGSKARWSDKFQKGEKIELRNFQYKGWQSSNTVGYSVISALARGQAVYFDLFIGKNLHDRVIINPYYFNDQYAFFNECIRQQFPYDEKGMSESQIYFDSDSYRITPLAEQWLETLLEYISLQTEFENIELRGFSDSSGSQPYNYKLSDLRVEKVKEFFMMAGIKESRIEVRAYGERGPTASNKSSDGRALNRRVEIKINHG